MQEELFCFPSENCTHRLILLHGWGADAEDLIPFGKSLVHSLSINIELVSLNAPQAHPEGIGRQWYGLFPPQWDEANNAVNALGIRLNKLASSKIPLEKTVLMGFSQGGAMALATGINLPLAGLIGCSAYPHPSLMPKQTCASVFLSHGRQDEVVPMEASKKLFDLFQQNSIPVKLNLFEGGHEISNESHESIKAFLENAFSFSL